MTPRELNPDFSLVKFKKVVGGGSMQIVNQTVPAALTKLGYQPESIEAIVEYIAEHGHVIDAPGLRPEHYDVFDCAMGERAIKPMGHVRMMAAVQPGISGALSKTVNLPESATVEDIADIYYQGWKLGLKALAVYRDNCKVGQPLSDAKAKKADAVAESLPAELARPVRRRLPKSRPSVTTSFTVGGAEGYMTAGSYPDDGLGEVFLKLGKQGSTLAGVMDAFSMAISISLQYGVPLETYVQKFTNMKFEPAGMTDDPDIRMSQSIMDYIFRRLALDHLIVRAAGCARHLLGRGAAPAAGDRLVRGGRPRRRGSVGGGVAEGGTCSGRGGGGRPDARRARPGGRDGATRSRGRTHHGRAVRGDHRLRRRRPAVHDLRYQDAPRWQLLRLRGLRLDLGLQLIDGAVLRQANRHSGSPGNPNVDSLESSDNPFGTTGCSNAGSGPKEVAGRPQRRHVGGRRAVRW